MGARDASRSAAHWNSVRICALDGKAAVVYRSATTPPTIREILLDGTWSDGSLDAVDHPSAGPSGNPFGRRATNNMDSVVYLGTDSGVYEQRLGLTVTWNFVRY